jgi:hypothetical protein
MADSAPAVPPGSMPDIPLKVPQEPGELTSSRG